MGLRRLALGLRRLALGLRRLALGLREEPVGSRGLVPGLRRLLAGHLGRPVRRPGVALQGAGHVERDGVGLRATSPGLVGPHGRSGIGLIRV